jgi:hypothetical protein
MLEQNPYRMLTLHKPEGTRRVSRPAIKWLDPIEEDLKTTALEIGDESHKIRIDGEQS